MASLFACLFAAFVFHQAAARYLNDGNVIAVTSATLHVRAVARRDLTSSGLITMRLELGLNVSPLVMELSQDSAWNSNSTLLVRKISEEEEETVEDMRNAIDNSCFLSGRLTSHNGAVSINRCGKLTGLVQTDEFRYEIEGEERNENENLEPGFSDVKVTILRSSELTDDGDAIFEGYLEAMTKDAPTKRSLEPAVAEVGVFLDESFIEYMSSVRNIWSDKQLTSWIILKWNLIRKIYGNEAKLIVSLDIQLKSVELWRKNPAFYQYLGESPMIHRHLVKFCSDSPRSPAFDHRMLYTKMGGSHHSGVAFLGGICDFKRDCSVVKSGSDDVHTELHQFGHNLGLLHDHDDYSCHDPAGMGGFMGLHRSSTKLLDCYGYTLEMHLHNGLSRCLFEENVPYLPSMIEEKSEPNKETKKGSQMKNLEKQKKKN